MGIHVTKYETKEGKTTKVKTGKSGAADKISDADKIKTAGTSNPGK